MSSSANRQRLRWSEDGTKVSLQFRSRRHEGCGEAYEGSHDVWLLYADRIVCRFSLGVDDIPDTSQFNSRIPTTS